MIDLLWFVGFLLYALVTFIVADLIAKRAKRKGIEEARRKLRPSNKGIPQ